MKRRFYLRALALSCLSLLTAQAAPASPVEVNLVAAQQGIQPGQPFYVGLHLKPKKNYHTYYKHPGIVGVPTSMEWRLPKGWKADPITWPEPKRVMMYTIQAQGYHGEMVLPIKVYPPKDLVQGSKVELQGKATWMCCYRDCNPGSKELSLSLEVNPVKSQQPGKQSQLFEASAERTPRDLENYDVEAKRDGDHILLMLRPQNDQAVMFQDVFFLTENELIDPSKPQEPTWRKDRGVSIRLPISEYASEPLPKKLEGLIQIDRPWRTDSKSTSARLSVKIQP